MLIEFANINITENKIERLGAKANSLNILSNNGFTIPKGFVVSSDCFNENLSEDTKNKILKKYDEMNLGLVAVRSSANVEDSLNKSFAGQFESYLNIDREGILEAILNCWNSQFSDAISEYYKNDKSIKMAVIVQSMVDADVSGVAFNMDPVTRDKNKIIIEAVRGNCEPLVQGAVNPEYFEVHKNNFKIIKKDTQENHQINDSDIIKVANLVDRVSKFFKYQADIEWAISDGELYLLQSRPITTL